MQTSTSLSLLYEKMRKEAKEVGYSSSLVPGEGAASPRLLLIGEAPGAKEEAQGKPFVGSAGKNLDSFLQHLGLTREEIYITNLVKLRPSKLSPAGNLINRPPSTAEKAFFTSYLYEEIALLAPKLLVPLGNNALNAFCKASIGEVHGRLLEVEGYPVFPLYHPAAILYNQKLKKTYAQDLDNLKAYLQTQIAKGESS